MSTLSTSQAFRTQVPTYHTVTDVNFPQADLIRLSNGIPVYSIRAGTQEVVKIELLVGAGIRHQQQPLIATAVNDMLDEGIPGYSAEALAEELDYYGAFIETETAHDTASLTLWSLNRHLNSTLPLVRDMLYTPTFLETELDIYRANRRQKFLVDSGKVSVLARRNFTELLFGPTHPYGTKAELSDFDRLNRQVIVDFHKQYYTPENTTLVVSGMVTDEVLKNLEECFGKLQAGNHAPSTPLIAPQTHNELKHTILKEDAIQSAIRVGRILFNRTHADYNGMQVLNTVLGGYFGSRLMANIREDKGYTYGIGSGIVSLQEGGYFVISTEVGVDVTNATLFEIGIEINRLQQDLIPAEELDLVRNYMTGVFLRSTDGPFALADRLKALLGYQLDYSYYKNYLNTIRNITAEELRTLAQRYLDPQTLTELVAGRRNS